MRQRDDHGATMTTSPADMPVLRRHRERRLRRHLGRRATAGCTRRRLCWSLLFLCHGLGI